MNLWLAALATLSAALAGVGFLRILWPSLARVPLIPRLALGFCVGTFIVAAVFFAAFLVGAPFSRGLLFTPIGLFGAIGVMTLRMENARSPCVSFTVFVAFLLMVLALALSWVRPVYGYDALSMWALKAKVAFFAKTWPPTLFDPHTTHHTEYPPLVPSAQAFVCFWLNAFDDVASRVVFAAFFASGGAILSWLLGQLRASCRGVWLLWWCALPLLMEQVKITYADLPLAAFLLVFFGATVLWLREPQRREWLWLAALFGGMAFWVKQDALIGVGGGYAALAVVAWKRKLSLRLVGAALAVATLVACPWPLFALWKKLPSDFGLPTSDVGNRMLIIVRGLLKMALVDGGYAFFWPVFVLTVVVCRRRLARSENLWLALATAFGLLAMMAVYSSTTQDLAALLKTSADRVLLSLFLPALLLVALLWRSSFAWLRMRRWQIWTALGVAAVAVSLVWVGLHRQSSEEVFGIAVSPFPLALSWVWLVVAVITLWEVLPRLRRARPPIAWRATQFAVALATFGLAIVSVGVYAREWGECWRRFGRRTVAEKHEDALDPTVREAIAAAFREFPRGTHVRVTPKRSIRYHEFYYETFPDLVVDDSATNVVTVSSQ
ncbi:MAG TPA: hypothetical protein VLZ12_06500 [Verrucomicrobiae bacterium]|nr:hypothetical protein [Verrucomicrobiae bacterium]